LSPSLDRLLLDNLRFAAEAAELGPARGWSGGGELAGRWCAGIDRGRGWPAGLERFQIDSGL